MLFVEWLNTLVVYVINPSVQDCAEFIVIAAAKHLPKTSWTGEIAIFTKLFSRKSKRALDECASRWRHTVRLGPNLR